MKKAVIDQILLWIVLFIAFATMFFFIIDYTIVVRTQDKCEALAQYAAKMKSMGKDVQTIVPALNQQRGDNIQELNYNNWVCTEQDTNQYQIVVTATLSGLESKLLENKNIVVVASSFNEINQADIHCELKLEK